MGMETVSEKGDDKFPFTALYFWKSKQKNASEPMQRGMRKTCVSFLTNDSILRAAEMASINV